MPHLRGGSPPHTALSRFATLTLTPRPGTDVAWINGLMHVILNERRHDSTFIVNRTEGFALFAASLAPYTPDFVESITGIPAADLAAAARLFAQARPGAIVYCMGITQHATGTDNVKALANLAMLTGNLGVSGGGVNPLRGQNNVQGACDMGCLPNVFTGYQAVADPTLVQKMETAWGIAGLSSRPGLTATEMTPNAHAGEIKALYIVGDNPMLHAQTFTRGLGMFHFVTFRPPAEMPDDDYPLILTTGRLLYHYHSGTMTMKSDGLNDCASACRVALSAADAAANRLTNAALDPVCHIPELKVCAVSIKGR